MLICHVITFKTVPSTVSLTQPCIISYAIGKDRRLDRRNKENRARMEKFEYMCGFGLFPSVSLEGKVPFLNAVTMYFFLLGLNSFFSCIFVLVCITLLLMRF